MSSLSTGDSGQHNVVRETVFYRLDKLVWEMRQAKSGLEMKLQKTFFSSTPSACTAVYLLKKLEKGRSLEHYEQVRHHISPSTDTHLESKQLLRVHCTRVSLNSPYSSVILGNISFTTPASVR
ncbi:hypothetical protein EB796_002024 [Bugula neritina]|uniref:Uncharacterized protein n=1 Tax=Bugula neritina TaxID=10212 RepID=A0A7J7KNE5_BUGNE|nr:hypothetical protein EB796_002024 [Bugula neritina]